jgi:hypothetical protein
VAFHSSMPTVFYSLQLIRGTVIVLRTCETKRSPFEGSTPYVRLVLFNLRHRFRCQERCVHEDVATQTCPSTSVAFLAVDDPRVVLPVWSGLLIHPLSFVCVHLRIKILRDAQMITALLIRAWTLNLSRQGFFSTCAHANSMFLGER